jgi:hypothetical protein
VTDRICSTPSCDREVVYTTKRLCKRCYKRTTYKRVKTSPFDSAVARFERRVEPSLTGCWTWTGEQSSRPSGSYGLINLPGRRREYAHRWSYGYHRAEIPEGLEIDHLCHNTLCVNPWHLEPVTRQVNAARTRGALKTHCKRGHEFTPENTKVLTYGNGKRECRTCARMHARSTNANRVRVPKPPSEFCKNGHPMSGENLVEKSGLRICRACRSLAAQAANAKRWGVPL